MLTTTPATSTSSTTSTSKSVDLAKALELRFESTQPESWWWFSFGSVSGWLGGAHIRARGPAHGIEIANKLGINPGGEVVAVKYVGPEEEFDLLTPKDQRHKLLSKADLEKIGGYEKIPKQHVCTFVCEECNNTNKKGHDHGHQVR